MTDEQQTEQSPIPKDDLWIAEVPMGPTTAYIVFGGPDGHTYDATYATREQAEGRIKYIRNGGDGW